MVALLTTLFSYSHYTYGFDTSLSVLPVSLLTLPRKTLDTITGNMLGDGSIRYPNLGRDNIARGNARYYDDGC